MGTSLGRIDCIDHALFISGVVALEDTNKLHELGIRYILNVAQEKLYDRPGHEITHKLRPFKKKIIGSNDHEHQDLFQYFHEMADFIEEGRKAGGIVVHCAAGISRAATACIAYLMLKENLSLEAAFIKVHKVRIMIHPNVGFWRQLHELQASLVAEGTKLEYLSQKELEPVPLLGDRQLWEIVGGAGVGGIIVRNEKELSSEQREERLSTGATVLELELSDSRLRFQKLTGSGPMTGWVSVHVRGKWLAQKTSGFPGLCKGMFRQLNEESERNVLTNSFFLTVRIHLTGTANISIAEAVKALLASLPPEGLTWMAAEGAEDGACICGRVQVACGADETGGSTALVRAAVLSALGASAVAQLDVETTCT